MNTTTHASTTHSLPFQLYRPKSGHPDWNALHAEALALAERIRPGLKSPRWDAREVRRRARSYATALRNLATNRALARAGRQDLRPLYFIWTMLRTCNFACTYCDDHRGHKYPDLSNAGVLDTQQAIRLLRVMRTRTPSVYFAGGEPTLRKDLPQLTRAASDLGYYPLIINTNGSALDRVLGKPAWSSWLADMDIIIVSLDGLHLSTLAEMWKYEKSRDVIRNVLMLRELADEMRFKLMVNCVIQPGSIDQARDVLDFANDLGIWLCPVPVNVGPSIDDNLLGDPAYRELVDLILERKRAGYRISGSLRMNERLLNHAPFSCHNTLKPHVDYDGRVVWPCKATVNVEPAYVNVLDFDHLDALYDHASSLIDPTGFAGDGPEQCGASCNWAQNYSTDAYAYGLTHPWSLVGDVVEFLRAS